MPLVPDQRSNATHKVSNYVVNQLKTMKPYEQKAFISQIIDQLSDGHLQLWSFIIDMVDIQAEANKKLAGTMLPPIGTRDIDREGPYHCFDCGKLLEIPEYSFYSGMAYCKDHTPTPER